MAGEFRELVNLYLEPLTNADELADALRGPDNSLGSSTDLGGVEVQGSDKSEVAHDMDDGADGFGSKYGEPDTYMLYDPPKK